MGAFEHFKSEWAVVKGAPLAVLGFFIAGAAAGYAVAMTLNSQAATNTEILMRLKDTQLEDLKRQLEESTPGRAEEGVAEPDPGPPIPRYDPNAPIETGKGSAMPMVE